MKEGLENGVEKYATDKVIQKAMDKAQKEVSCMFFDHKWPILLPSLLALLPKYLMYFDHKWPILFAISVSLATILVVFNF